MTEEPQKITAVVKTKDPRRLAAGKRLAEISQQAKERKLREKIKSEKEEVPVRNHIALAGLAV